MFVAQIQTFYLNCAIFWGKFYECFTQIFGAIDLPNPGCPVGDSGEQRLAAHILWNLLGFGGPRAVHEQRHLRCTNAHSNACHDRIDR